MVENNKYRQGVPPQRYGCHDYSLEMQLLQLKKRVLQVTSQTERKQIEVRISEIETQLGM